jgi:hypothetical protein
MNQFKKTFLIIVGVISITFDEATKSVKELKKNVKEQREKFSPTPSKTDA